MRADSRQQDQQGSPDNREAFVRVLSLAECKKGEMEVRGMWRLKECICLKRGANHGDTEHTQANGNSEFPCLLFSSKASICPFGFEAGQEWNQRNRSILSSCFLQAVPSADRRGQDARLQDHPGSFGRSSCCLRWDPRRHHC